MYQIIPFQASHQEDITRMMTGIQEEFDTVFRYPASKTISDIVSENDLFWVALHEGRVVGTIGLSKIDDNSAFLRHLFVSKGHRGANGVSGKLLEKALEMAKARKYTFLYLGTMEQLRELAAQRIGVSA